MLIQNQDPAIRLMQVAEVLDTITDKRIKANLTTAASVFGGLVLKPDVIKTILRSEIMKESAVYQENLLRWPQETEQK